MAQVRDARPGHRFQEFHDRTKRAGQRGNPIWRVLRISLAMVAFTIGVVLVVIPGPAIPFFFVAAALLATESKVVAKGMDWLELRLRVIWDWGQKHWRRLPKVARVVLLVLMAGMSATGAFLTYRFIRG
jgi:hypothetical protein